MPKKTNLPFVVGGIIAVVILTLTGYFFFRYRQSQRLLSNPTEAAKKEQAEIIKKVTAMIEAPAGEEPTVATIADIEKLKDKPFFTQAQNGDKVIVYANAKKAILYRPSSGKVVEMTVINPQPVANPTPTPPSAVAGVAIEATPVPTAASTPKTLTVTVLNGTRIAGLAAKAETFISGKSVGFNISTTGNAQNRNQDKTLVVDVSGVSGKEASDLATLVGGTVARLPEGEIEPSTDLLLILGTDASF